MNHSPLAESPKREYRSEPFSHLRIERQNTVHCSYPLRVLYLEFEPSCFYGIISDIYSAVITVHFQDNVTTSAVDVRLL